MKIYILSFEFQFHGEVFVRSVHMTKKGAMIEQLTYLCMTLLEYEHNPEDVELIDSILLGSDTIREGLTMAELANKIEAVENLAKYSEIYTEIVEQTLYP